MYDRKNLIITLKIKTILLSVQLHPLIGVNMNTLPIFRYTPCCVTGMFIITPYLKTTEKTKHVVPTRH